MVGSEVVQRVEMRDDAQGRMRRPGTCILGFAFLGVNACLALVGRVGESGK